MGRVSTSALPSRGPQRFRALYSIGSRALYSIGSSPQVGRVATSPLQSEGSLMLQNGEQNQKWPTSGCDDYATLVVVFWGTKSEVGHKWVWWLRYRCRLGAWKHEWASWLRHPCYTRGGGGPNASQERTKTNKARKHAWWLHHSCGSGVPNALEPGTQIRSGPQVGLEAMPPSCIWSPQHVTAGDKIRSGPQVGAVATSAMQYEGSRPLQSGGQNQKWPTSGPGGYVTPAVWELSNASERWTNSDVVHRWARWLPHPKRRKVSPPLQSRGQNHKWANKCT